jgi:hypothetical protein
MGCDSFEGVSGSTGIVVKRMQGLGGIDHFDHEMMLGEYDSSVMSSNLGRKRRSSVSGRRSGILVELEGVERDGQKRPRKNSEACSMWFGVQVDDQRSCRS